MRRLLLTFSLASVTALAAACASEAPEPIGSTESPQLAPCTDVGGGTSAGTGGASGGMSGMDGAGGKQGIGGVTFTPGAPYVAPGHQGNLIHVKNGCSFPLYIH